MDMKDLGRAAGDAAQPLGLDPAHLLAIGEVETGLNPGSIIDGRLEPLIRFEGHYFDRRLSGTKLELARAAGLASPRAGAIANPQGQAARRAMLARAAGIDVKAAMESTSWGLGQVMGAHWAWLGFADVEGLVAEARGGVEGQFRLMARYLERAGLAPVLRREDWTAFARAYNGPGYRANNYDRKIAAAYRRHAAGAPADGPAAGRPLRFGDRGDEVAELQARLSQLGYSIAVDGIFGPQTLSAVKAFQKARGLVEDGIVGPLTRSHLHREGALGLLGRLIGSGVMWLLTRLRGF